MDANSNSPQTVEKDIPRKDRDLREQNGGRSVTKTADNVVNESLYQLSASNSLCFSVFGVLETDKRSKRMEIGGGSALVIGYSRGRSN